MEQLERNLDECQNKFAKLMGEYSATQLKLQKKIHKLEGKLKHMWRAGQGVEGVAIVLMEAKEKGRSSCGTAAQDLKENWYFNTFSDKN